MPSKKKKTFHIQRNRDRKRKIEFNDYNKGIENEYEISAMLGDETHWKSMTQTEKEIIKAKQSRDNYVSIQKVLSEKYGCMGCFPYETPLNLWNNTQGNDFNDISDFLSFDVTDKKSFYCEDCYFEMELWDCRPRYE